MPSAPSSPSRSFFSPPPSYTSPTISTSSAPSSPSTGIPSRYFNAFVHANANENVGAVSTHHDEQLPPHSTSTIPPCAACTIKHRKCRPECMLAPYFPRERKQDFHNVHKLFGIGNMTKKLRKVSPSQHQMMVNTMVYEANMHAADPSGGCVRLINELEQKLIFLQNELSEIQTALAFYRNELGNSHTNLHAQQFDGTDHLRPSIISSEYVNMSQNNLQSMMQDFHDCLYFDGNPANGTNNHNTDI